MAVPGERDPALFAVVTSGWWIRVGWLRGAVFTDLGPHKPAWWLGGAFEEDPAWRRASHLNYMAISRIDATLGLYRRPIPGQAWPDLRGIAVGQIPAGCRMDHLVDPLP